MSDHTICDFDRTMNDHVTKMKMWSRPLNLFAGYDQLYLGNIWEWRRY
jgi:hypothetical protein